MRELEELKEKLEDSEIQNSHTNEQLKIDVQSLIRSLDDEKQKVCTIRNSKEVPECVETFYTACFIYIGPGSLVYLKFTTYRIASFIHHFFLEMVISGKM